MTTLDIRGTVVGSAALAIKQPCLVATTGSNITLSGIQAIDGVSVGNNNERVLVKDQGDQTTNGIYIAQTGPWLLAADFANGNNVAFGTLVLVTSGAVNGGTLFEQTCTDNPIVIATSRIAFATHIFQAGAAGSLTAGNNLSDVANAATALGNLGGASSASPALTGNPTATTQNAGDNSSRLATTAFVQNALSASAAGSFVQTGTGAVSRSLLSKVKDYAVTPQDFGALGNGSSDDTAAFQAALTAIANAGGGTLYIPPTASGYSVGTSTLTYAGQNLRITGAGGESCLTKSSTTGDLLQFSGLQFIQLDHFKVNAGTTATSGALFNFTNTSTAAGNFWLDSLVLLGGYDQVYFQGGQNTFVTNCLQQFFLNDGIHYGPNYAGIGIISGVAMTGIVSGTGTNAGCGIQCEGGDTFVWQNSNIASLYSDILIKPAATGFVRNLFASNVLCDGATRSTGTSGWTFDSSNSSAQIQRVHLASCWGGSCIGDGFSFLGVLGLTLVACRAIANENHGFHFLSTGPVNDHVEMIGCVAEWNSTLTVGTDSGVRIENGNNDIHILGGRFGPASVSTNTQKYGIEILGASHNNLTVRGADVAGNGTGGISTASTGTGNVIADCNGYNPVGTSAAVTMGASPFTVTAGFSPEIHYLNQSATNTATVAKGGYQVHALANAATFYVVQLGPNESYTTTWSTTAPTYTRDVH